MTIQKLTIYKGLTFGPLVISAVDTAGAVYSLSGWSVHAEIRRNPDGDLLLNLNPLITDEPSGEITIELSNSATDTLSTGFAEWDVIVQAPGGQLLPPIAGGPVEVIRANTQP